MDKESPPHILAHTHSSHHRAEIENSDLCGCFYCLHMFPPTEITNWTDERSADQVTANCPYCGIDSVIGSASGFPITEEFLKKMRTHWFE